MAEEHTAAEFWRDNVGVVLWLVGVGAVVLAIFVSDRRWRSRQNQLEKTTAVINQSHTFALNLVRHFMPSFKVQKYQFQGMQAKAGTADIEFKDLGLELACGKRVLQGVTGEFKAGRMCAVMGPSGAGKTTFMNTLCGKATYGKMTGAIHINGVEANISEFKSVTGFVPQDDIVHQELTVREQIEFSARLRNSVGTSQESLMHIVDDVLNVMQVDHIQNSIVGSVEERGISGGQRKRVNIGLELAAQPTVLFLDEPTSGLDSTSSLAVAVSLKKMCELGMTSIMVIHQPRYSLFTLFDDVLLLGKGGQTVYLGPSLGAKPYFEGLGFAMPNDENPADWFMDVLSGEVANSRVADFRPEMLFDMWRQQPAAGGPRGDDAGTDGVGPEQERIHGREMSTADDRAILQQKLEEGWDSVDSNGDGVMDAEELRSLLAHCSTMLPGPDVVKDLMERMAGDDAKTVTRRQFMDYLCSLRNYVATDTTLAEYDRRGALGPGRRSMLFDEDGNSGDLLEEGAGDLEHGPRGKVKKLTTVMLDPLSSLKRDTPGVFKQYHVLLLRRFIQWWRMNRQRAIFVVALALGGFFLAVLDRWIIHTPRWSAMSLLNLHTCLALLLSIFCLQVFANDQPVFWRESASGVSVPAFYLSRLHLNTVDILLLSFIFSGLYFVIRQPWVPFTRFFIPFLLNAFAASGWGYFISTIVPPKHGPFIVSLIIFIVCGLLGNPSNLQEFLVGGIMKWVVNCLSITRWTIQMNFAYDYEHLRPNPTELEEQALLGMAKGVFLKDSRTEELLVPVAVLVSMGVVLRVLAFLGLRFMNRDKQV